MARTKEQLDAMNVVSDELAEALRQRPFPQPPAGSDYIEFRAAHLRKLRHLMPVPGPIPDQVREEEHAVTVRDGHKVKVISYRPAKEAAPGPLIVLFHEGGWSMGDLSDEEFNARLLSRDLGATCLNVEYRLAPAYKFPTWINDCWDVLQWAASSASLLHADATKGFIVGGSSAGGNISAILSHLSRNNGLQPPVTGQWLSCPYLIPKSRVPDKYQPMFISMTESDNDPVLRLYPDLAPETWLDWNLGVDLDSPLFSVVSPQLYPPKPEDQKKGSLARAYFQIAGLDPLRDHALVYERILKEEYGVETKVDVYPGFGHMFWTNWPEMKTSHQFADDMVNGMRWLLGNTSTATGA